MTFIRETRPLYCVDEWYEKNVNTTLFGAGGRHDDFRQMQFEAFPCTHNATTGVCDTSW